MIASPIARNGVWGMSSSSLYALYVMFNLAAIRTSAGLSAPAEGHLRPHLRVRMAEAQARSAEAHADGLRAQGQLALDLADANARLATLEAELDAARRALIEATQAKPVDLLRRLRTRFV